MTNLKKQATSKRKAQPPNINTNNEPSWSHMDQLMTPVQMMTESDLQKELEYYAGAHQFRYPNEAPSYLEQRQRPFQPTSTPQLNIPVDANDYATSNPIQPFSSPAQYQTKSNIDHLNSLSMMFDRQQPAPTDGPLLLNHENGVYQQPNRQMYSNQSTPINSTPSSPNQNYFEQKQANLFLSSSSKNSGLLVGQDDEPVKKKSQFRFKKGVANKHPLDYLLLSKHNKQQEAPKNKQKQPEKIPVKASKAKAKEEQEGSSDEFDEDEPVIGDGAQSYSSMGSNSSRTSLTKDDKRRRNTAASARFRIKKKMREQALQSTACEMTDKAKMMEQRVHDLEREIKWLKALVVEKNDTRLEQLVRERPAASVAFPLYQSSNEEDDDDTYQY